MLEGMPETSEKSPSEPPERPDRHQGDDSADMERDTIALPSHVAGSGTLDRLVETARDYARQAASENTLKAYAKDWAHFARWCRMRGAEPLPTSPQMIGLYIADLAAPQGKAPALSAASIERRLSGLSWACAQRGKRLDRKDRHIATLLAGIRRKHARPPRQKDAILSEDLRDMLATLPHDLRGLRDRTILLIGFAGGLRRSEIVSLDHGKDDTPDSGGWVEVQEGGARITLRGKTGWREVEIGRGSADQTCPVHALTQWLHYARIDFGPLFVAVSRNGLKATSERLSDKHVARLIRPHDRALN
jgi:site-specific recombinase XerD